MHVLVTGGCGYIGSHTCVELLNHGHDVTILDNLSNSDRDVAARIEQITACSVRFIEGDVRDQQLVEGVLRNSDCQAVLHFAGLKAVAESIAQPVAYYDSNVSGTLRLLRAMEVVGVRRLIFSSSATIYGSPASVPIHENFPLLPGNPYGCSKLMVEDMLRDVSAADDTWRIAILRYFNPAGAHESGQIGEDPHGVPSNLVPYIAQVAAGKLKEVLIFGDDYPTPDGTGVRDYIHVADLAEGHVKALEALAERRSLTVNLGTGKGHSVLEMVRAFERACGRSIRHRVVDRRPGDVAECFADPSLAKTILGWEAQHGLDRICSDAWRWQVGRK